MDDVQVGGMCDLIILDEARLDGSYQIRKLKSRRSRATFAGMEAIDLARDLYLKKQPVPEIRAAILTFLKELSNPKQARAIQRYCRPCRRGASDP